MAIPKWIENFLNQADVPYEKRRHPDVFSAGEVAEREHFDPREVAKVVLAFVDKSPICLVLPADRKVELRAIEEIAGTRKVRLATEGEIERLFSDCEVGAIPPFHHWKGVEFWVDHTMETPEGEILFQTGNHHDAIRMRYRDWFKLVRPRVEQFAVHRRPLAGDIDEDEEISKGGRWAAVH